MSRFRKQMRPRNRRSQSDRVKVHLRLVKAGRTVFRVVTLRPGALFAFSTNYFHETWHILSDVRGAGMLARLMWGLSFQQKPNTVVLIDVPHIQPTPFGAEPSSAILLMLDETPPCNPKSLNALKRRLTDRGSMRTIRWHTFSMDLALRELQEAATDRTGEDSSSDWLNDRHTVEQLFSRERMFRRAGFVCYVAPRRIVRWSALHVARLGERMSDGMDYLFLARENGWPCGEVQIFADYAERCSAAAAARARTLADGQEYSDEESLYRRIAARRDGILRQRRREIRNRGSPGKARSEHWVSRVRNGISRVHSEKTRRTRRHCG